MAVPFRKVSKTRRDMRRTHYKITANGLSSSQPIIINGIEDKERSRRVEFRIRTNADEKMAELEGMSKND